METRENNNTQRDKQRKDWLNNFKSRNHLYAKKAEGTSLNRATAFNKQEFSIFFENFLELLEKYKFLPRNIHSVDESGTSSVQDPEKIVTEKGKRRVGSVTSVETGTVWVVCAMRQLQYTSPLCSFSNVKGIHMHW